MTLWRSRTPPGKNTAAFRPRLESLEDRVVPTSYYTITNLGGLGGPAIAWAISGQYIAGYSQVPNGNFHAFLYNQGTMTDLGTLGGDSSFAYGVSGSTVVGYSNTNGSQGQEAFVYQNGIMTGLGDLGGGVSEARAVSKAGIVGYSTTAAGYNHAFLYRNGQMTDIGTLGGNYSYAYGISDTGEIVGESTTAGDQFTHAFSWQNGVFTDLGVLPGGDTSEAYAVNNTGLVTGLAYLPGDYYYHAFLYQNGTMNDLGALIQWSYGTAINDAGQVVGITSAYDGTSAYGFLYQNDTSVDLGSLINNSNWYLRQAYGIGSDGEIVGSGFDPNGAQVAFVLTPPPATLTWTGAGGDDLWSDPANWSGNGGLSPAPGDTLVFGPGASQSFTYDDLGPGVTLAGIQFTGAGYTVSGDAIKLKGNIDASAATGAITLNNDITLGANSTLAVGGSATGLTLGGSIHTAGYKLQVTGTGGAVHLSGALSGGGSLADSDSGTLTLADGNSYGGSTTLTAGTLALGGNTSLGTGPVTLKGGAVQVGATALSLANAVTLGGSFSIAGGNSLSFAGAVSVSANPTITITNTGGLAFSGPVTLGSNLTLDGGAAAFSGATTLTGGSWTVTVNAGASAVLAAVGQSGTGSKGLTKAGAGTLTLTAANTYTAMTTVAAGTLVLDVSVAGQVTVGPKGTLVSAGSTGNLTVQSRGTLDPGSNGATGILSTGNLIFNPGGVFNVALDGTAAGAGYDQVSAGGRVNVTGAHLNLTLGYTAQVGDTYTLVNNTQTGAVIGTFAGLPQNATLVVGGETFQINYKGGDGNDVTLTCIKSGTTPGLAWLVAALLDKKDAGLGGWE